MTMKELRHGSCNGHTSLTKYEGGSVEMVDRKKKEKELSYIYNPFKLSNLAVWRNIWWVTYTIVFKPFESTGYLAE